MVSIKKQIYYYLELSKITKVPFLLISNPGFGKTTSIEDYAKDNGYHLQTLIGSQFAPEDILGFQVNEPNKDYLIQKDPKWYSEIINAKKEGKPSILFIDEISTCSDSVQGSLLSLIFSRKIGNGKKLPDDCLVISAANYSGNLSSYFNILTPTINRFCVINLTSGYTNLELANQFLSPREENIDLEYSEKSVKDIDEAYLKFIQKLLVNHSDSSSPSGFINLNNTDVNDIYKVEKDVYNIMTGRTIYYLKQITKALTGFADVDSLIVKNIAKGLIGAGSNNFDDTQKSKFNEEVVSGIYDILASIAANVEDAKLTSDDISEEVTKYLGFTSKIERRPYENAIANLIIDKYKDYKSFIKKYSKDEKAKFITDYDNACLFYEQASENLNQDAKAKFASELQLMNFFYCKLLGIEQKDIDVNFYGLESPRVVKKAIIGSFGDDEIKVFGQVSNSLCAIYPTDTDILIKNGNYQNVCPLSQIKQVEL